MTTITNPTENRAQAIFLKGHCRMHAAGMRARGVSATQVLKLAGEITGKKYKRGQFQEAANDLQSFLDEGRAA